MHLIASRSARRSALLVAAPTCLIAVALLLVFLVAPTEATMGGVQRIMYVHVSVAWLGLLGFVISAATGAMFLAKGDLGWDHGSQAAAELGWLASTLTLVTGSLWASEAWGTWWTWDPRLTTEFVLWVIYSGYLIVRSSQEDPYRRARAAAVVAILGALDVPLVVLATRWFRGMHPVAPQLEPAMRGVLLFSAVGFSAFFGLLFVVRRKQIQTEYMISDLECRIVAC
jgi:heme exporter protein C